MCSHRMRQSSSGFEQLSQVDQIVHFRRDRSARRADGQREGRHGSARSFAGVLCLGAPRLARRASSWDHTPLWPTDRCEARRIPDALATL